MSRSLPPRPAITLDVSHQVQHAAELDESHQVEISYEDPYSWTKPDFGNECYDPVKVPTTPHEIEMHRILYPYSPAIHRIYPLVCTIHVSI